MNENTSTCVKCGYTLDQHDYVHGVRGNCGNFVDAGPFFDDRPLLDMNDITQLSTLYSNAIARAEKAEEALREMIYEVTHLSAERDDGSHDCRISKRALAEARAALVSPPPVRETP